MKGELDEKIMKTFVGLRKKLIVMVMVMVIK